MSQGIGGVGHAEAEILADFQLGVSVPLAIRQFMAQLVYTVHASLHLCWKENLLNNQKVSKYCEDNCTSQNEVSGGNTYQKCRIFHLELLI